MTVVDDVEEHVRRVGAVGEVAHLVDHQDVGMGEARERLGQTPLAEGRRELVDELCGGDEERLEPVLDRPVGDGDRKDASIFVKSGSEGVWGRASQEAETAVERGIS